MTYFHRRLETPLQNYLRTFCVVGITGPRQSGKSTLLQQQLPDYEYVTFDDYRTTDFFENDPESFMARYANHVIFDEVQKAPKIFNYIKVAVDSDRQHYGKYLLTGSSQFHFIQNVTESLAGRIGLLSLLPMQLSEIPETLQEKATLQGGYPELVLNHFENTAPWYGAYLETYLTRDVSNLAHVGDLRDFRRCLSLLATQVGQILNFSTLAKEVGVSVTTIQRWISVLEASYIIFLLPPYFKNFGKRLIKSPKVYFWDTGLVSFLLNLDSTHFPANHPITGHIFENYVVSEIHKEIKHQAKPNMLYYFRTSHGDEVDLVIHKPSDQLDWIEIKQNATFRWEMLETIQKIKRPSDRGILIYQGKTEELNKELYTTHFKDYLLWKKDAS